MIFNCVRKKENRTHPILSSTLRRDAPLFTFIVYKKRIKNARIQLKPTVSGNYIFTGMWGSLPAGEVDYLQHIDPALNSQNEVLSKPAEETNLNE